MEFVTNLASYIVPFVVVLTIIVFVHELGHYWVARRCGVRVEVFSIGFGPELFGWYDKNGTRWKISAIPLGGFVKRSEEHTSELQSLMSISYAVFCLKKKKTIVL